VLVDSTDAARAERIHGCIRAEVRGDSLALTFLCAEPEARRRVTEALGVAPRQATAVSLEDVFVDLVGDPA
jgi:hypothetical protein